jgi:predicted nucleotidyltransferase
MPKPMIQLSHEKLANFCQHWRISELAFFGSVLRSDFQPESDVDVLVTFAPDANWSLFDFVDMQDELQAILERPVDLLSRRGVEADPNYLRRQAILNSAQVVYALS